MGAKPVEVPTAIALTVRKSADSLLDRVGL